MRLNELKQIIREEIMKETEEIQNSPKIIKLTQTLYKMIHEEPCDEVVKDIIRMLYVGVHGDWNNVAEIMIGLQEKIGLVLKNYRL